MSRVSMQDLREDTATRALSILLQHPTIASNQQNICSLLQVCKCWRAAMQKSEACSVDAVVKFPLCRDIKSLIDSTAAMAGFAEWLPAHAGMVRSITALSTSELFICKEAVKLLPAANALLSLSMRTAAAGVKQNQTAQQEFFQCTSASSAQGPVTMPGLQLQSYASDVMKSAGVLSALPAATLTSLKLTCLEGEPVHKALAGLSNLRSLTLQSNQQLPLTYFDSVRKLSHLTRLDVEPIRHASTFKLLPEQLRQLTTLICCPMEDLEPAALDLSHLTKLHDLDLCVNATLSAESRLPDQMQRLRVNFVSIPAIKALGITALQKLQQLTVQMHMDRPEEVMRLACLPQQCDVELQYSETLDVTAAAATWGQLPQLRGLRLSDIWCSAEEWSLLCQSVGEATTLGRLWVNVGIDPGEVVEEIGELANGFHAEPLFKGFKHFQQLREVGCCMMTSGMLAEGDLLHLTALTGLTKLSLDPGNREDLDGTLVTALAVHLTALQCLVLNGIDSSCKHALPAIGMLRGLTELALVALSVDDQQRGLRFLSRLRKLRQLRGFESCGQEIMEGFWIAVQAH